MSHANRWSIVIAAWLLCSPPAFAAASFKSGNELLQECTEPPVSLCFGYIEAVTDALVRNSLNGYEACVPQEVTVGQLQNIVVQYLRQDPRDRHLGAIGLVAHAISNAFPCRQ
jgi:hypothetical protein